MEALNTIKQKLGINQTALAVLIDAGQYNLSRYETGTRTMPLHSIRQIAELYNHVTAAPAKKMPAVPPDPEAMAELRQHADWCRAQCHPIQKALAKMQVAHQQAQNMLHLLDALPMPEGDKAERKQRWMDEQRYQANKRLIKNGWLAQKKLEIKITLLQQDAVLHEQLTTL